MFSLDKGYPENLKLRRIITDLIFWHEDINENETLEDLITQHYKLLRDSMARNSTAGSPVLRYKFKDFTGSDLDELDWLSSFGLFEFKARCQRNTEELQTKSDTWLNYLLTVEIAPTDELAKYINSPSNETIRSISAKITHTIRKYQDHEENRDTFFMDFSFVDRNGQILSVLCG